jgi:hypothetical protein
LASQPSLAKREKAVAPEPKGERGLIAASYGSASQSGECRAHRIPFVPEIFADMPGIQGRLGMGVSSRPF